MLYWGQGMVVPVADMPKQIMHSFTNANVIDGRFTYQDTELKNRNSDAAVSWNDPRDFFNQKTKAVFDTDMRVRYGYRETKFTSYGCTSPGQAHRHGTYVLATNRYETEMVTFQAGFEAMYLRPGDVIGIVDNYRIGLRQGGRVKSVNGHWVTVDTVIAPFPDAQEIFFYWPRDANTIGDYYANSNQAAAERPPMTWQGYIYGMHGAASATFWVGNAGQPPPWPIGPQTVFVIGANYYSPNIVPQAEFRILTISERQPNVFEITAVTYQKGKFDLIDFGIQFQPPLLTRIPSLTHVLPPNNLQATLEIFNTHNVLTIMILVTWEQPPEANIRGYRLQAKAPNTGWVQQPETTSTSYYVMGAIPGLYDFKVSSINHADIASVPAEVSITVPDTSLIKPHRVSGLELQDQGNDFTYYVASPTLAWRLNSPTHSYPFNSEAPYGAGVGDFDPYFVNFQIVVYDAVSGKIGWTDHTTDMQYVIDHYTNVTAWGDGQPRHNLRVTVQAVDKYGIEYLPVPITIDNPPPPAASNLQGFVSGGPAPKVVGLTWTSPATLVATAPESVDITQANIYMATTNNFSTATLFARHSGVSNAWNSTPIDTGTYWFFVTMQDSFGSESAATTGVQIVV
jgi:predicted phage tail protein